MRTDAEYTKLLDITRNGSENFVGLSERRVKFWIDDCNQPGGDENDKTKS